MSSTSAWLVALATGAGKHIGEFVSTPLARGRAFFNNARPLSCLGLERVSTESGRVGGWKSRQ